MKQADLLGESTSTELALINDYKEYTGKFSESPEAFHLFTLFFTVACLMGRSRWIQQGEDTIYPNLYVLVVAKSSLYMKSSSIGLAPKMLKRLDHMNGWIGHIGSPEGLFGALEQTRGGIIGYYSELGLLLSQTSGKKYMSDTLEMLNDLYDCPDYYSRRLAQGLRRAKNVCLNLMSASQMDSLSQHVRESTLLSGFLPRFAIVFSDERRPHMVRRPAPDVKLQNKIVKALSGIRDACQKNPGPMDLSPTAWELFETWAHDQWARALSAPPQLQPAYGRMEGHVLKLAMIIELTRCDYSTEIDLVSLETALDCAEFMMRGYRRLVLEELTFTVDERKQKKVLDIIKTAEGSPVPWRDIITATRYKVRDLTEVVQSLEAQDKIELVKGKRGGRSYSYKDPKAPIKIDREPRREL